MTDIAVPKTVEELAELQKRISLLKRAEVAQKAKNSFMTFVKFTSPDPEFPSDVEKSRYKDAKHHRAVAKVLEKVIDGTSGYNFLVLTLPPRHGKSELVSRKLPAWLIGKFPDQHGVVATYSDTFAEDFGREVRSIVSTPQFKQVFPEVSMRKGGGAADRLQTTRGGQWSFVGRGGSLTGRGAHCFPAETLVETENGAVPIALLCVGQKVLSYDVQNRQVVWRAVEAVQRRPRAGLLRITTASGRVVEATSDHRFYANGRWVEAGQLACGDRLVCAVRRDVRQAGLRSSEALRAGAEGLLLQPEMLGPSRQHSAVRGADMLPLRQAGAAQVVFRDPGDGPGVLLESVLDTGAGGRVRGLGGRQDAAVRPLQRNVHAAEQQFDILRPALRVSGTRQFHGGGWQPAVEGRGLGQSGEAPRHQTVSRAEAAGADPRRPSLRLVRKRGRLARPSHRRGPAQQPRVEPGYALPAVSPQGPFFSGESDVVVSVESACRSAVVYDIQVAETECFFANGVLAHNCLIIDDLIKDDKEAQSQAIRDQAWAWFTKVAMSRRMGRKVVIMTFTRWHNDDPIGRLTDPENPYFNEKMARRIKIINIPAIAEDDDPLGRQPGEPLWPDGPDRFDLDFLEEQRALDPIGFAALYQQRPSLQDGDLYQREHLKFYRPDELPEMRIYGASDHAVATGQRNDFTVLLKFGVDKAQNIYLLDCFWQRAKSDVVVEALLSMATGQHRPLVWFAEKGHISKAIGPFLKKRMAETGIFMPLREITPASDKVTRAQSMIGRAAMGKLFFPADAIWTEKAINQLMAFPSGTHDDFVDALSIIGLVLQSQFAPMRKSDTEKKQPQFGTLDWVKQNDRWAERQARRYGGF